MPLQLELNTQNNLMEMHFYEDKILCRFFPSQNVPVLKRADSDLIQRSNFNLAFLNYIYDKIAAFMQEDWLEIISLEEHQNKSADMLFRFNCPLNSEIVKLFLSFPRDKLSQFMSVNCAEFIKQSFAEYVQQEPEKRKNRVCKKIFQDRPRIKQDTVIEPELVSVTIFNSPLGQPIEEEIVLPTKKSVPTNTETPAPANASNLQSLYQYLNTYSNHLKSRFKLFPMNYFATKKPVSAEIELPTITSQSTLNK